MFAVAKTAGKRRFIPAALAAAAVIAIVPTTGFALPNLITQADGDSDIFGPFTPATVDPQLAERVARSFGSDGMRFTPAVTSNTKERPVTVAVRVDEATARAISVRSAIETAKQAPGRLAVASAITQDTRTLPIVSTKYNLGVARGYQGFAKKVELPGSVNRMAMPDLAQFEPAGPTAEKKPGRFQTRIAMEKEATQTGRAPKTLEGLGQQSIDVGGAYRVVGNVNVTAGVRLSQDRDRIAPLTDSVEDSQAVYVGTQIRF